MTPDQTQAAETLSDLAQSLPVQTPGEVLYEVWRSECDLTDLASPSWAGMKTGYRLAWERTAVKVAQRIKQTTTNHK